MKARECKRILCVFCALFVFSVVLLAQQTTDHKSISTAGVAAAPSPAAKDDQAEVQEATQTLEQVFQTSRSLDDRRGQIKIQAEIADALWILDRNRAKSMFQEAFQSIDSVKEKYKTGEPVLSNSTDRARLRSEVLSLIAKRDSSLADALINTVQQENSRESDGKPESNIVGPEAGKSSLFANAAGSLIDHDPESAANFLRKSIASGIDPSLLSGLAALRVKNPVLADQVFAQALSHADVASPGLAINYLAPYVFPEFGQGGTSSKGSHDLRRAFLEFSLRNLGRQVEFMKTDPSQASIGFTTAKFLVPYIEAYFPEGVVQLQFYISQFAAAMAPDQLNVVNTVIGQESVDSLLEKAKAAPQTAAADAIYVTAIKKMLDQKKWEQALSVVSDIHDEGLSAGFDAVIRTQAVHTAIADRDASLATKYARDLQDPRQKTFLLIQIARMLIEKKDEKESGVQLLYEAQRSIENVQDNADKARCLLLLSNALVSLDTQRAFDVMNAAIRALNQSDVSFNDSPVAIRSGGKLNLLGIINEVTGLGGLKLTEPFTKLSRANFLEALSLARAIREPQSSLIAQVAVCRARLNKAPGPETKETSSLSKVALQ